VLNVVGKNVGETVVVGLDGLSVGLRVGLLVGLPVGASDGGLVELLVWFTRIRGLVELPVWFSGFNTGLEQKPSASSGEKEEEGKRVSGRLLVAFFPVFFCHSHRGTR